MRSHVTGGPLRGMWFLGIALAGAGCAVSDGPWSGAPLPLSIEAPRRASVEHLTADGIASPAICGRPEQVAAAVALSLDRAGCFASLPAPGEAADLALELRLRAGPRGWGEAEVTPLAWLTGAAWFFGGIASWWIPDRVYPHADLALDVRVRDEARGGEILLDRSLPLAGPRVSFVERAAGAGWLLQLVCPPSFIPGDPARVDQALSEKALDRVREDVGRVLAHELPKALYDRRPAQILLAFPPPRSAVPARRTVLRAWIASRVPLRAIAIAAGREERILEGAALVGRASLPGWEEKRCLVEIRRRSGAGADVEPPILFYRLREGVPIAAGGETIIRIRALAEDGSVAGSWTVPVRGPEGEALVAR